ncbi:uncharacterized protein LOC108670812 [Hyalella azteca]|uniref:Uncharacterized protein LOC108670812 n=1 Tax=Hyalella azteca TaxID=294128 RepID=A0A8B7NKI0_HYAAZ|nr:uncharacterized protein LOC108670812 [Hyalella azteca]
MARATATELITIFLMCGAVRATSSTSTSELIFLPELQTQGTNFQTESDWKPLDFSPSQNWREIINRMSRVNLGHGRNTVLSNVKAILAREMPLWDSEVEPASVHAAFQTKNASGYGRDENKSGQSVNNIRRTLDLGSASMSGEADSTLNRGKDTTPIDRLRESASHRLDIFRRRFNGQINQQNNRNESLAILGDKKKFKLQPSSSMKNKSDEINRQFRYKTKTASVSDGVKIATSHTDTMKTAKKLANVFKPSVQWWSSQVDTKEKSKPVNLNIVSFNTKKLQQTNALQDNSKRVAILHIPPRDATRQRNKTDDQQGPASQIQSPLFLQSSYSGSYLAGNKVNDLNPSKDDSMQEIVTPFLIIPHTGKKILLSNLSTPVVSDIIAAERRQDINPLRLMVRPFKNLLKNNNPNSQPQLQSNVQTQSVRLNRVSLDHLPPGNFIIEFGPPKGEDIMESTSPESINRARSPATISLDDGSSVNIRGPPLTSQGNVVADPQKPVFIRSPVQLLELPALPLATQPQSSNAHIPQNIEQVHTIIDGVPLQSMFRLETGDLTSHKQNPQNLFSGTSTHNFQSLQIAPFSETFATSGSSPSTFIQPENQEKSHKTRSALYVPSSSTSSVSYHNPVHELTNSAPPSQIGFGHPHEGSILIKETAPSSVSTYGTTKATPTATTASVTTTTTTTTKATTTTKRVPPLLAGKYQLPGGTSKPGRLPWPNTVLAHLPIVPPKLPRGKDVSSYSGYHGQHRPTAHSATGFKLPDLSMFNPFKYLFSSRSNSPKRDTYSTSDTTRQEIPKQESDSFSILDWFTAPSRSYATLKDEGPALPFSVGLSFPSPFLGVSAQLRNKSPARKEPLGYSSDLTSHFDTIKLGNKYKIPQTVPGGNVGNGDHYKGVSQPDIIFQTTEEKSPLYYVLNPEALTNHKLQVGHNAGPSLIPQIPQIQNGQPEISSYSELKRNFRRGKHSDALPEPRRDVLANANYEDGKIKLPTSFFSERLMQLKAHFSQEDQGLEPNQTRQKVSSLTGSLPKPKASNAGLSSKTREQVRDPSLFVTADEIMRDEFQAMQKKSVKQVPKLHRWRPIESTKQSHSNFQASAADSNKIIEVAPQAIDQTDQLGAAASQIDMSKQNNNLRISVMARRMGEGEQVFIDDVMDENIETTSNEQVDMKHTTEHEDMNFRTAVTDVMVKAPVNDDEYYFGLKKTINHIPISKAMHQLIGTHKLPKETSENETQHSKTNYQFNNPDETQEKNNSNTDAEFGSQNTNQLSIEQNDKNERATNPRGEPITWTSKVIKHYEENAGPQAVNLTRVKWGFWQAADMDNRPASIELQRINKPVFHLGSPQQQREGQDDHSTSESSQSIVVVKAIPMNERGETLANSFEARKGKSLISFQQLNPEVTLQDDEGKHIFLKDESTRSDHQESKNAMVSSLLTTSSTPPPVITTQAQVVTEKITSTGSSNPTTENPTTQLSDAWMRTTAATYTSQPPVTRSAKSRTRNDIFIPGFHDRKKKMPEDVQVTTTTSTTKPKRSFPRSYYTTPPRPTIKPKDRPLTQESLSRKFSPLKEDQSEQRSQFTGLTPSAKERYTFTEKKKIMDETKVKSIDDVKESGPFSTKKELTAPLKNKEKTENLDRFVDSEDRYEVAESQTIETEQLPNIVKFNRDHAIEQKRTRQQNRLAKRPKPSHIRNIVGNITEGNSPQSVSVSLFSGFIRENSTTNKSNNNQSGSAAQTDITSESTVQQEFRDKDGITPETKFFPITVQPIGRKRIQQLSRLPSRLASRQREDTTPSVKVEATKESSHVDDTSGITADQNKTPGASDLVSQDPKEQESEPFPGGLETKPQSFFDRIRSRLASFRSRPVSAHAVKPSEKSEQEDEGSERSVRSKWIAKLSTAARSQQEQPATTETPHHVIPKEVQAGEKVEKESVFEQPLRSIADHFNSMRQRNKFRTNIRGNTEGLKFENGNNEHTQLTSKIPDTGASNVMETNMKDSVLDGNEEKKKKAIKLSDRPNFPRARAKDPTQISLSSNSHQGEDNQQTNQDQKHAEQERTSLSQDTPQQSEQSYQHQYHDYEIPQYHNWEPAKL